MQSTFMVMFTKAISVRLIARRKLFGLLAVFLFGQQAFAQSLSEKIHQAALVGLDYPNLRKDTSPHTLYGQPINTKDLNYGWLACARVVSAVLLHAGIRIPRLDSQGRETAGLAMAVYEVETKMKRLGWMPIRDANQLQNGDIIVWRKSSNTNRDFFCSGGGSCHIGILTSKGAFNNHLWWGSPSFGSVELGGGFLFKIGYRPK